MFTEAQFNAFSPFDRGFITGKVGKDKGQPNIPDEENPYKKGTKNHKEWERGRKQSN